MGRKKKAVDKSTPYIIHTCVGGEKYGELTKLLKQAPGETMSSMVRKILSCQRIRIAVRDQSMHDTMEELVRIRSEIRRIGVNINQMTKKFHTYPEPLQKQFYAKIAFEEYKQLQPRIDKLLAIAGELAKKWLT